MSLLFLSFAPVFIILLYIYFRDKYEKEPLKLVLKVLLFGALSVIPILIVEKTLTYIGGSLFTGVIFKAFYDAFVVAGFTEELFKFLVIYIIIWKNSEFNDMFDGIVYATFASLGFALVENLLYVFSNGFGVGIIRAFTAVPAHAIFGITMGFFFGLAKFGTQKQKQNILLAILLPMLLHGFYDFILMSQNQLLLLLFIPYLILILVFSFRMMKQHTKNSKFNPKNNSLSDDSKF